MTTNFEQALAKLVNEAKLVEEERQALRDGLTETIANFCDEWRVNKSDIRKMIKESE